MNDGPVVLDTPEGIEFFRLCSFIACVRLELKGLRHSRGSMTARAKQVYGLKGSKQSVLEQLEKRRDDILERRRMEVAHGG